MPDIFSEDRPAGDEASRPSLETTNPAPHRCLLHGNDDWRGGPPGGWPGHQSRWENLERALDVLPIEEVIFDGSVFEAVSLLGTLVQGPSRPASRSLVSGCLHQCGVTAPCRFRSEGSCPYRIHVIQPGNPQPNIVPDMGTDAGKAT